MLEWRPVAAAGFWELALSLALAALVYLARPEREQNRFLALFLLLNGLWHGSSEGVRMVLTEARDVWALGAALFGLVFPTLVAYLLFLSTLDSPLSRPLRNRRVRWVLGGVAVAGYASAALAPRLWFHGLLPWRHVGGLQYDTTAFSEAVFFLAAGVFLFSLAVGITAYRRARTTLARRRMGWYLAAFIVHDTLQVAFFLILNLAINAKTAGPLLEPFYFVLPALMTTVLAVLLTYGILQTQLFEIELKVKQGVRRSVVVGAFVLVFFAASEGVEAMVSGTAGTWAGLGAAALLALGIRPLERGAERIADGLMPSVEDTPAYREARRLDIYRSALEDAALDGMITERERAILEGLQQSLGIQAQRAAALEQQVLAR